MKQFEGYVETIKTGSLCEFEFEVDDDATEEEIEEAAREAMFEQIDWAYQAK